MCEPIFARGARIIEIDLTSSTKRKKIVINAPYFAVVMLTTRARLYLEETGSYGFDIRRGDEFGTVGRDNPFIGTVYIDGKATGKIRLLISHYVRVQVTNIESATAIDGIVVTPNDATELDPMAHGLYIGTAGDVAIITPQGTTVVYHNLPAGTTLPVDARIVMATGTTAANIIALRN